MKTIASFLIVAVFSLASCRGSGGPMTRAGRGVDHAFEKTGQGIEHVGRKIERAF
jgi:predicted small secreted protein